MHKRKSGSVSHSVVSDSATLKTEACQAPLSIEFSRQEYWSGLPFPSLEDLPDLGFDPRSPALQEDSLPSEPLFLTLSDISILFISNFLFFF